MKPDELLKEYEKSCEDLHSKIAAVIEASMINHLCVLDYHETVVNCLYKGKERTVSALTSRKGKLFVWFKDNVKNLTKYREAPTKEVEFISTKNLINNVVAATQFPKCLQKKAEKLYNKPLTIYGKELTITEYVGRLNSTTVRETDDYIFMTDVGINLALKASMIRKAANQINQK